MHRQRPRQWTRVMALAREADRRCRWHARLPGTRRVERAGTYWRRSHHRKTSGWPAEPRFTGYRPTSAQWAVLFTLAETGRVPVGLLTVPGGTVDWKALPPLVREGLIVVEGDEPAERWAELTDEGRVRTGRGW